MKSRIILSINTAWNIYNFRSGLVKELIAHGYEVIAVAPDDKYAPKLRELGCKFIALPMDSNGTHIGRDVQLLFRYFQLFRKLRPVAYLGYTVKPNIYGSLAAHALGIPVVNNIAGLGATFISQSHVTKIVKWLYKIALKRSHRVFFQNSEDRDLFLEERLVDPKSVALVPGSGIDLKRYAASPVNGRTGLAFLFVGRILKDKGVVELAKAAKTIRDRHPDVVIRLLGTHDPANPNAVPEKDLMEWVGDNRIEYLGTTDDVRPFLAQADCVVLPSYREGVPRSLLEAAAMARPIVATDVPGCRDVVDDGVNGFLCKVKDADDLAEKMLRIVGLTRAERQQMGFAGRAKVESEFDERIVLNRYIKALASIAPSSLVRPILDPLNDDRELLPD